jgi:hypothetical protein
MVKELMSQQVKDKGRVVAAAMPELPLRVGISCQAAAAQDVKP